MKPFTPFPSVSLVRLCSLLGSISVAISLSCGSGLTGDTNNIEIRALNVALAENAPGWNVQYLDTYSILLGQNGKPVIFFFEPDGEHLSEQGYLRWSNAVLIPYIKAKGVTCAGMVGDSITRRTYVVLVDNGTRAATWDDLLGIKAYNEGVDGETSQDVINRLDSVIQPDIDCYFLMIGNNDLHAGIRIEQIIANVETIVRTIQARTGKPVVVQAVMPLLQ
jgi:lysophospholipase L1-like esterase